MHSKPLLQSAGSSPSDWPLSHAFLDLRCPIRSLWSELCVTVQLSVAEIYTENKENIFKFRQNIKSMNLSCFLLQPSSIWLKYTGLSGKLPCLSLTHFDMWLLFLCFRVICLLCCGVIPSASAATSGGCGFFVGLITASAARSGLCAHRYVHCIYK